jgi:hypothetical protein
MWLQITIAFRSTLSSTGCILPPLKKYISFHSTDVTTRSGPKCPGALHILYFRQFSTSELFLFYSQLIVFWGAGIRSSSEDVPSLLSKAQCSHYSIRISCHWVISSANLILPITSCNSLRFILILFSNLHLCLQMVSFLQIFRLKNACYLPVLPGLFYHPVNNTECFKKIFRSFIAYINLFRRHVTEF